MCDLNQILGILTAGNIFLIAAIASCGVAIALNLGIITAGGAPIAFGIALAAGLAANLTFTPASMLLAGCATGPCAETASALSALVAGAVVALVGGIAVAYIAVLTAGFPAAGVAPMAWYGVTLAIASGFVASAIDKVRELETCLASQASNTTVFIVTAGTAMFLSIAGILVFGLIALNSKKKP